MADTRRRLIAHGALLAAAAINIMAGAWYLLAYVVAGWMLFWLLMHDLGKAKPKDKK